MILQVLKTLFHILQRKSMNYRVKREMHTPLAGPVQSLGEAM